jgi:ABC-type transport system involved in cytochrome bd biosynthesis fused ATPase/permease subunit
MFPLGVVFFEVLGLILWISLADTGYGLSIGLPIMLLGLLAGITFFFAIMYMKKKLIQLQNDAKKGEAR